VTYAGFACRADEWPRWCPGQEDQRTDRACDRNCTRCDGCIGFHTEALVRLGATREEVEETLGMTIYMGGGPSLMHAADAISAFEEFQVQVGVAA
jgi:hypothetical protein